MDFPAKYIALMISIHALRVEGDNPGRAVCVPRHISIHALRVDGDINRKS